MSIFRWVKLWTGIALLVGSLVVILAVGISGAIYATSPDEPKLNTETGEYCKSKSEIKVSIWNTLKVIGILIWGIYALGIILGSAVVTGWGLLIEEKMPKFK